MDQVANQTKYWGWIMAVNFTIVQYNLGYKIMMYICIQHVMNVCCCQKIYQNTENEISKYISSVSKNGYIDKFPNIVNKYNNIYHSIIKMKSSDVNSSIYIDFDKKNNIESPKI